MLKYITLFLAIFSLTELSAKTENVLLLTHPVTKEAQELKEGSYLVFELKSDKSIREGFIREILEDAIILDDSQVSLSQIKILAGSSKAKVVAGRVANTIGNALLFTGMTVFDCGLNIMFYEDFYYWPIGGSIWVAGALIAGLGHVFDWAGPTEHSVRVRNYREWEACIVSADKPLAKENKIKEDSIVAVPVLVEPQKEKNKVTPDDVYGD